MTEEELLERLGMTQEEANESAIVQTFWRYWLNDSPPFHEAFTSNAEILRKDAG